MPGELLRGAEVVRGVVERGDRRVAEHVGRDLETQRLAAGAGTRATQSRRRRCRGHAGRERRTASHGKMRELERRRGALRAPGEPGSRRRPRTCQRRGASRRSAGPNGAGRSRRGGGPRRDRGAQRGLRSSTEARRGCEDGRSGLGEGLAPIPGLGGHGHGESGLEGPVRRASHTRARVTRNCWRLARVRGHESASSRTSVAVNASTEVWWVRHHASARRNTSK